MREQGMTSAYARGRSEPHRTRADEARLANLLDRGFDGYAPHTHLASDLTYVRVGGDWAYVCLLVDLANRGIVGHSAGRTELIEPGRRNRQLEMEADVSEQAAPVFARRQA